MNWGAYPNFKKEEFDCKHTGKNHMRPEFMDALQNLRIEAGFPFIINSGYRHSTHPVEAKKDYAGEHTFGLAADIRAHGHRALHLIRLGERYGFNRIGVHQYGPPSSRYIHLGMADTKLGFPSPTMWSYPS